MKLPATRQAAQAAALALLLSAPAASQPLTFTDAASDLGLDFRHHRAVSTNLWFPEIMSGGGGWLDYDGDGDLDAYLVQGGELAAGNSESDVRRPVDRLYRNDGTRFVDVTESAFAPQASYGMGLAIGDIDGDGDPDVYVTNVGPNTLLRNNGDGTFADVTDSAGVGEPGWGSSATFVDYDLDGHLDLFVVNYVRWSPGNEIECFSGGRQRDYCHPSNYNAPAADVLYRNRGDGTFEDVTVETGVHAFFGNGLGVAVADFDRDGRPDIFVANDGMPNQLWLQREGRFVNEALITGTAVNRAGAAEAGMGVVAADLDGDGATDLFMTHLRDETNTLYLNRGGWFDDVTAARGLGAPSIGRTGFGAGAADFDHDGRLDLVVVNGRVGRAEGVAAGDDPFAEPDQYFRGLPGGRFEERPAIGLSDVAATSRAAAFGDFDGDGDMDVLAVDNNTPARLLRNEASDGAWSRLLSVGPHLAPVAGVEFEIESGGHTWRRRAERGSSYCASHDPAVHFGLAEASELDALSARWPSGDRQRWHSLPTDRVLLLYERYSTAL